MRKYSIVTLTVLVAGWFSGLAYADSSILEYQNHWYQRINYARTWHDAQNFCASTGGHLVTISSVEENQFVYDLSSGGWLGGTDENSEGSWEWLTGEPWSYSNWNSGEPNNCGDPGCTPEHYLTYSGTPDDYLWNDVADGVLPFTCEWETSPIPGTTNVRLYDNFSGTYIDNKKWRHREFVREVADGKLVLKMGNSTGMNSEMKPGWFRNSAHLVNSPSINAIECDITVIETELDGGVDPESLARITGYFYNIHDSGGSTGDIYAQLLIGDRGNGDLEAFWRVSERLDDDGWSTQNLGSGTLIGPGTLQYGTTYTAKISYNGNRIFTFTVNGQSEDFEGPEPKRPAVLGKKGLSVAINTTNSHEDGFVSATFDNVYINNQIFTYDIFASSPLDPTKWDSIETVAEITEGHLRLNVMGYDERTQTTLFLTESDTPYLEAKTRVDSGSWLSPGAGGIARIQGNYYNDSRGPGSGQDYNQKEGNVFAEVRLIGSAGGLWASARIYRMNNFDSTDQTVLLSENFTVPVNIDTYYTVSIHYTGEQLVFKCNDETKIYTITTPQYKPYDEHRALRSRLYLDPGESGYVKAFFDEVYIEKKGRFIPAIPLLLLKD
jgi:hypothetical protein